ncbi:hypothetical protein BWZ20_13580 [Winogradskyella sp. J14-2]|uniref:DUF2141 domain-containing protein n=1 Tax=Winogradskyella sp. J14-2 TaxID=1936080 RepID=UPI000972A908|nr:DUF2141 domain-containing protein [Winogradskyella sp. J14-2]APY09269.1 hypothetical protein BWZ20_13580 [Winogradskyella sp. J14-2]
MKNLILTFAFALITLFSFSQDEGITITVTIDNVTSNEGKVLMSLHTSETFMKGKGIKDADSTIEDGKVTMTFKNVLPGEYAILALHDVNDNKRMDFEENGMPKESFGMSNNVMLMGPPQYDDAKFTVADKDLELNIRF